LRVVIDTNVWVSAVISPTGPPAKVRDAFLDGLFEALVCDKMIEEVLDVLRRPRIRDKYGIPEAEIDEVGRVLGRLSTRATPEPAGYSLRDPEDDYLLELAVTGEADFIVTGDGDLQGDDDLPAFLAGKGIGVVSPREFISLLGSVDRSRS
jgi:putative PIN family toxin of toxin-antitoxin system